MTMFFRTTDSLDDTADQVWRLRRLVTAPWRWLRGDGTLEAYAHLSARQLQDIGLDKADIDLAAQPGRQASATLALAYRRRKAALPAA
ncbi:MAG: hypothetical protein AAGD34_13660 [Pseudomonadota bacterium]